MLRDAEMFEKHPESVREIRRLLAAKIGGNFVYGLIESRVRGAAVKQFEKMAAEGLIVVGHSEVLDVRQGTFDSMKTIGKDERFYSAQHDSYLSKDSRKLRILRRSRLLGRTAGNCSNSRIALRSAAAFRRSSLLSSVSR